MMCEEVLHSDNGQTPTLGLARDQRLNVENPGISAMLMWPLPDNFECFVVSLM